MRVWRCSCGKEWEESGDGEGVSQAWKHTQQMAKEGKKEEHAGLGLFDTETGELLVKSFNASLAVRRGYTKKRENSLYAKRKKKVEEQSGSLPLSSTPAAGDSDNQTIEFAIPARRKKTPTPMRGKVPLVQIDIPAELWYLYILSMARFPGLNESSESFTEWLTYCIFKFHILYADVFGLKNFLLESAEGRGISIAQ